MTAVSADEYSRELSVGVSAGQSRLVELGFGQGGTAGFGLRRLLVDLDGKIKRILAHGERKSNQLGSSGINARPGSLKQVRRGSMALTFGRGERSERRTSAPNPRRPRVSCLALNHRVAAVNCLESGIRRGC